MRVKLPLLPSHISPLGDGDSARVEINGSKPLHPCLTCGDKKVFKWYSYVTGEISKEVVEFDCPCTEQWLLHRWLLASGILLNYQRRSLMDLVSTEALDVYSDYMLNAASYVRNGIGLILSGPSGTGKTLTSILISKALIAKGFKTYYSTFNELIGKFADGWHNEDDKQWFYKRIKNAQVLVLDDLGRELKQGIKAGSTNVSRSVVDEVLRHRVGMALPTFITTNSSLDELSTLYGLAVLSLFNESCIQKKFYGSDYRSQVPLLNIEEVKAGLSRPIVL